MSTKARAPHHLLANLKLADCGGVLIVAASMIVATFSLSRGSSFNV